MFKCQACGKTDNDPDMLCMPRKLHDYPCLVSGCFSRATMFATGNEAVYGHVCKLCWESFSDSEQKNYTFAHLTLGNTRVLC